jgi:hypothetical protein
MVKSKRAFRNKSLKLKFKNKKGGSYSMIGNATPSSCMTDTKPLDVVSEPKLSVDYANPRGISQLGTVPTNSPPTISEQAFSNRYNWSGDSSLTGAGTDHPSGLSSDNYMEVQKAPSQSGGKRKNKTYKGKQNSNKVSKKQCEGKSKKFKGKSCNKKKSSKKHRKNKKSGGGYYLSLEQPKIAGQSVVSGYENCISDPKF